MHTSFVGKVYPCRGSTTSRPGPKAVRLVTDHRGDYASEWEAITTIAGRLGMTPETLRRWVRHAAVDAGEVDGVSTAQAREIREMKRKNAELEQTIEIL